MSPAHPSIIVKMPSSQRPKMPVQTIGPKPPSTMFSIFCVGVNTNMLCCLQVNCICAIINDLCLSSYSNSFSAFVQKIAPNLPNTSSLIPLLVNSTIFALTSSPESHKAFSFAHISSSSSSLRETTISSPSSETYSTYTFIQLPSVRFW